MSDVQGISLCELNAQGQLTRQQRQRMLVVLWRRCLKMHRNSVPDRLGEARAFAQRQGCGEPRLLMLFHCIEGEYGGYASCESSLVSVKAYLADNYLPYSAVRIYETKVLGNTTGPS